MIRSNQALTAEIEIALILLLLPNAVVSWSKVAIVVSVNEVCQGMMLGTDGRSIFLARFQVPLLFATFCLLLGTRLKVTCPLPSSHL